MSHSNILSGQNSRIIQTTKTYQAEKDSDYKIELLVKIKGKYYSMGTQEFSTKETENSKTNGLEIMGIHNEEEYLLIQPEGNYVVLEDLDLRAVNDRKEKYTIRGIIQFNGNIDFNGKIIERAYGYPLFQTAGSLSNLKNLELNLHIEAPYSYDNVAWGGFAGIAYYNYGNISNLKININEFQYMQKNLSNVYFISHANVGIVDHFILNYSSNITISNSFGIVWDNKGTIKNGYVYGNNLQLGQTPKGLSQIAVNNIFTGIIENIFVLNKFESTSEISNTTNIGNITANNSGIVKNVYSVENGALKSNVNVFTNVGIVENSFYFDDIIAPSDHDLPISKISLIDSNFQNNMLNSESAFNVDSMLSYGYYPQLKFPTCMKTQDFIKLPEIKDIDLPDILSSEVIEENTDTAKVKIVINNPKGEKITNLNIENIKNEILSSKSMDFKTELIVLLKEPTKYISKYSIKSLTTVNSLGLSYTRSYKDSERIINVSLYRKISTINDWKSIKVSPTENYKIVSDLDFINESSNSITINSFSGILDGNNHKIKNINISNSLIQILSGKIVNLFIENLNLNDTSGANYKNIGIISQMPSGQLDNFHAKNITINSNGNYSKIGGVIGYAFGASKRIANSSISNLTITASELSYKSIGGFLGHVEYSSQIYNCYAQNINLNLKNVTQCDGIGGFIGISTSHYNNIYNIYASGNIEANSDNIGGIIGTNKNRNTIHNTINLVKIKTNGNNIGGIVGKLSGEGITNNISIGNIWNSNNSNLVGNICGFYYANAENNKNFFYNNQLVNGEIFSGNSNEIPLSSTELFDKNIYLSKNFGSSWDYSKLGNGILPKLYYSNSSKLLPNQEDIYLIKEKPIKIEKITSNKKDALTGEVSIILNNPNQYKIDKINIEYMQSEITKNVNQNGKTYINLNVKAFKYYDNYNIASIIYEDDLENTSNAQTSDINEPSQNKITLSVSGKVDLQFFKDIGKIEDWQEIDSYSAQNYRLIHDIDFSNINDVNTNASIGRLQGNGYKITGIKNINDSLINKTISQISDVTFENITIVANKQGYYLGIIGYNNASLINVNFNECNITNKYTNSLGLIGKNDARIMKNIHINDISIKGEGGNVAGFIGDCDSTNEFSNIYGNNISVYSAKADKIGGLIGYKKTQTNERIENINITNSTIIGDKTNNIGGVLAGGSINNVIADNLKITGINKSNYLGGIIGYANDQVSYMGNLILKNSIINGNNTNQVGGIYGQCLTNTRQIFSINNKIYSNYGNVGGISGVFGQDSQWININTSGVIDTLIKTNGDNIGGFVGELNYHTGIHESFIENSQVIGRANVGGFAGVAYFDTHILRSYSNASVQAGSNSAGGLIGKYMNKNVLYAIDELYFYDIFLEGSKINSPINSGGLIGELEVPFRIREKPRAVYLHVDISGNDNVDYAIGKYANLNEKMEEIKILNLSSKNKIIAGYDSNIDSKNLTTVEKVYDENWYKNILKANGYYWDFSSLKQNLYPLLAYTKNQKGITLPNANNSTNTNLSGFEYSDNSNSISLFSLKTSGAENSSKKNEQITASYDYNENKIDVYETYSIVNGEKQPFIYIMQNGKLAILDGNLKIKKVENTTDTNNGTQNAEAQDTEGQNKEDKNNNDESKALAPQVIIDFYNNNEYQTILGEDGKLYDLKSSLNYPKNFVNKGIDKISSDTEKKILTVNYENGAELTFNYMTGEILSNKEADKKESLTNYIKNNLFNTSTLYSNLQDKYNSSKLLKEKLEREPIEEYLKKQGNDNDNNTENGKNNINSNNNTQNSANSKDNYVIVYNSDKNDYEVYKESSLLNDNTTVQGIANSSSNEENELLNDKTASQSNKNPSSYEVNSTQTTQQFQSETSKIESNQGLRAHYLQNSQTQNNNNGWIWIVTIIAVISATLMILRKFIIARKKGTNKKADKSCKTQ